MSLVIAHIGPDAVHLVSDTAALTADGVIGGFQSKVYPVPHLNMAIGIRGHLTALPIAAIHLQGSGTSFDEVFERAHATLKPIFLQPDPSLVELLAKAGATQDVEITIAGISEAMGPVARQLTVTQNRGRLEWSVNDICRDDEMVGPFTPDIADEFEQRIEAEQSGRLDELGWLADRARRIKSPVFGRGKDVYQIGGHAVLTKITSGGIETRILRNWGDEIGKEITLDGGTGAKSQSLAKGWGQWVGQLDQRKFAKAT